MMLCPKCHNAQQSHPSYTKDQFGREWLEERQNIHDVKDIAGFMAAMQIVTDFFGVK